MSLVTTRAVVLQTYRYSETSKILRLMTWELGPCSTLARGALRPRSRFGGLLEPFVEGEATFYMKEGRDLHTLSNFELVRDRRGLDQSIELFTIASVLCELVMRLAPEHRDATLYQTLTRGLDGLHGLGGRAAEGPVTGGLEYVWGVVDALGFRPELERCVVCRRRVGKERVRFDFPAGGLRCASCGAGGPRLDAAEIDALRALVSGVPAAAPGPYGNQGRWLAEFIRYHLAEGAKLNSLPFLSRLT
ncbi:DNA repair protein RecO [Candidatus Palauibacter sp.]|uniref:DNA repair protein RecO n=1 Tax=Candidatus Palauibacter sp. TaxID=3101350 RepID=UPI003B5C66C3